MVMIRWPYLYIYVGWSAVLGDPRAALPVGVPDDTARPGEELE